MAEKSKPTIMDIARELGVTHSTVSRALAGNSRISEDTRQRVLQVAKRMDYSRKRSDRGLRAGKTNLIELAYFTNDSHLYQDPLLLVILDNLLAEFESLGYSLTLNIVKGDFLARRFRLKSETAVVDGSVIVTAGPIAPFNRHQMDPARCIFMDNQLPGYSSVNFDSESDLSLLLEHVGSKGCERICALAQNPEHAYSLRQRVYCYEKLCSLGHFELINLGVLRLEDAMDNRNDRTFEQLLDLKPDAIVCLDGPSLCCLLHSGDQKGGAIASDPMIVSFMEYMEDDMMKTIPGIRLDFAELARQTALCLAEKLNDPSSKPSSLLVQSRLTIP